MRSGNLGDLGDVSNPQRLDALIGGPKALAPSAPGAPNVDYSAEADRAADHAVAGSALPGLSSSKGAVPSARLEACTARYAAQGNLRFSATGTYAGRPAVVLGIESGRRTIVFVVAADDCGTVLFSVSR